MNFQKKEVFIGSLCRIPAIESNKQRFLFPLQYDTENGLWEDEDTRTFYENLKDLKSFVPQVCSAS